MTGPEPADGDCGPADRAGSPPGSADVGDGDRDRDAVGRPRNARPRDGLGRPLDRDAAGEPGMPEDLRLTPAEAVLLAQQLIDQDRPFHAHEVLEAAWKSAQPGQRDLWQGLAQIAVGLTHARRGNSRGAVTLLRRGADAVGGYLSGAADEQTGQPPGGLDAAGARQAAAELADRIIADGLASVPRGDLRIRLRRPGS